MKYLSALKSENPLPDELQKVQKTLFTVFTVREEDTFQKKSEQENIKDRTIRAQGYGCGCGHNLYQQVEEFIEEPEDAKWEHQYRLCKVWQCEKCKAIYEIIGGSKGPVLIQ